MSRATGFFLEMIMRLTHQLFLGMFLRVGLWRPHWALWWYFFPDFRELGTSGQCQESAGRTEHATATARQTSSLNRGSFDSLLRGFSLPA
jgi:hypothetical protein